MKTLPLFYYPSSWLWIDDDKLLLDCMALVYSEENSIIPFQKGESCLNFLQQYKSPLSLKNFLTSNMQDISYGFLKHTPVDFDITMLARLADDPNRFNEISVMVIDYEMPDMNGFAFAQATQHLPIQKILLTGKAEHSDAISGFNTNLIHRFVQKQWEEADEQLSIYLKELSIQYFQKISSPLLSYLEVETTLPLSDPIFINFFENYCEKNGIKEYYLIDKEGSFLCIDSKDKRSCLVVQSDRGLDSWLATYKNEGYLASSEFDLILDKKKIPFFGIGKEGWEINSSKWLNHLFTPQVLDGVKRYYWAKVDI